MSDASASSRPAAPGRRGFTSERYASPEFLARERRHVFARTWLVLAREAALARPGDCLAIDELDTPLLLVRGTDGVVRAFRNSCLHRGTRLVAGRCHTTQITCPYHGWRYALDGRLLAVPKRAGFAALDADGRGLAPVRSECWGGFVWVTFAADAPPLRDHLGALAEVLAPWRLPEMRPLLQRTWTLSCNWKAVLDQATESYHLRAVHPRLGELVETGLQLRGLEPHYEQTVAVPDYPLRDWLDARTTPRDLPIDAAQRQRFHKYLVFPNTLLNVMPYHLTVFRVFPLTVDTCRLHYEFHVRRPAGFVARARGWATLLGSLLILREDLRLLPEFQAGVAAAGNRPVPLHREEEALAFFHDVLDRHLAADPPSA